MNTSVIYATTTGNSKKIAEAISFRLKVKSQNTKDIAVPKVTDTVIIVGGIYFGKSKNELKNFVNSLDPEIVKRAAVITTSGAGQARTIPAEIVELLKSKNITVLGEFSVRGKALIFPTGHPNEADLKAAADWVVSTIKG